MKDLDFMWRGGNVVRYHTHPTLRPDYVGHHSYNGACIVMHLRPGRDDLVVVFLRHDMAEWKFGDMPAPAKRAMPDYVSRPIPGDGPATFREVFGALEEEAMEAAGIPSTVLAPEDAWLLKLADSMDGMRYCIQERRMGNIGIEECYRNFEAYVGELLFGVGTQFTALDIRFNTLALSDCALPQDVKLYEYLRGEWYDVHGK